MKLSKEITSILERSDDFFTKTSKLIAAGLGHLAVSPLYLSIYHAISALAYKNGSVASSDEELMRWFQDFNAEKQFCNSQLPSFFRKLYIEKQNLEYKKDYSVSDEKIMLWFEEVLKYRNEIIAEVKKIPDFSPQVVLYLKYFMLTKSLSDEHENAKNTFIEELKHKVIGSNPKVLSAFNELMAKPDKLELYGAFKIRFLDFLEENPERVDDLHSLLETSPDLPKSAVEAIPAEPEPAEKKQHDVIQMQTEKSLEEHPIIVPWDFTKISEYALEYAVNFAHLAKGKIYLLHVVKKDTDLVGIEPKLKAEIQRIKRDHQVEAFPVIRTGSIFSIITDFAEEIKAKLVIMGTHGKQGMQKLTGSNALKVMLNTKVPFIIVQKPPQRNEIKNVVFPVDYRTEIKQKVNQARYLNKYYDLKFYISKPEVIKIENIRKKTLNNLHFMRMFFVQHGIDHEIVDVKNTKDWSEATLKLASELNADLIIIVLTKELGLPDMLFGAEEEKIIMNPEGIPVMCINPPPAKNWTFNSGFG
jgi:nucleotide-binding universal stress UspA family protein/uncharacterized protein (UPF0332 family)